MTLKVKAQEKLVKISKNDLGTHRPGRYELRRGVGKKKKGVSENPGLPFFVFTLFALRCAW